MLSESSIINFLHNQFPEKIGDDAAILPFSETESYVITKDLLVEDVHFRLKYQDAASLAHKALHVNLSDIAAMGAIPKYVLLGISIPQQDDHYIHQFLQSFSEQCKAANVLLIGGDTTKSPDKLFISVTAIGIALNTHIKLRSTAKPGDLICISGNIGHAHIGFTTLEGNKDGFDSFKSSFLKPKACLQEALSLGSQPSVTAMMDLSDGLYIDLQRLSEASKVAATINLDALEPSQAFQSACKQLALDSLTTQLTGGEDYSLLFTLKPENHHSVISQFKFPVKVIGQMMEGTGVQFIQNGQPHLLNLKPFTHFGESL